MATPILRVRTVISGWQGAPGLNTNYLAFNDSATPVDNDTATACVARVHAYIAMLNGIFPSLWLAQISSAVDVVDSASGVLVDTLAATPVSDIPGVGGSAFGPASAGMLISWRTATIVAGHRLRGRTYWSPCALVDDTNGTPTAAQIANCLDAGNAYIEPVTDVPDPIVWHRPVGGAGGTLGAIVQVQVPDYFAVLRSRR